jgi:hypothetical protein
MHWENFEKIWSKYRIKRRVENDMHTIIVVHGVSKHYNIIKSDLIPKILDINYRLQNHLH